MNDAASWREEPGKKAGNNTGRHPRKILRGCSVSLPPRAHGAEWRAPEHRSREAQRAACRSAPGRRSRQALAAASAESEGP